MVAGDHVYNHYVDCRDSNYFLSEDSILDVLALPGEKVGGHRHILKFLLFRHNYIFWNELDVSKTNL